MALRGELHRIFLIVLFVLIPSTSHSQGPSQDGLRDTLISRFMKTVISEVRGHGAVMPHVESDTLVAVSHGRLFEYDLPFLKDRLHPYFTQDIYEDSIGYKRRIDFDTSFEQTRLPLLECLFAKWRFFNLRLSFEATEDYFHPGMISFGYWFTDAELAGMRSALTKAYGKKPRSGESSSGSSVEVWEDKQTRTELDLTELNLQVKSRFSEGQNLMRASLNLMWLEEWMLRDVESPWALPDAYFTLYGKVGEYQSFKWGEKRAVVRAKAKQVDENDDAIAELVTISGYPASRVFRFMNDTLSTVDIFLGDEYQYENGSKSGVHNMLSREDALGMEAKVASLLLEKYGYCCSRFDLDHSGTRNYYRDKDKRISEYVWNMGRMFIVLAVDQREGTQQYYVSISYFPSNFFGLQRENWKGKL